MRRNVLSLFVAALVVALSVGVATAYAGGGNSANAKLCQKDGWMTVQGSGGTQFTSQDACVSFGANGGTIVPKPPCIAGSENFSEDAPGLQPTTFAGGTIDGPYGPQGRVIDTNAAIAAPAGTVFLYSGDTAGPFRLTFTNPVGSVHLDAASNSVGTETLTLTAYDTSGAIVGTPATFTGGGNPVPVGTLSVASTTNNIDHFTLTSTTGNGLLFTNIVWSCA